MPPTTSSAMVDDTDTFPEIVPRTRAEARALEARRRREAELDRSGPVRHARSVGRFINRTMQPHQPTERIPYLPLLLMAAAGFVTMMTEALPVSVMPSMRQDLGWSDGMIGQLVTAYAIGCGGAAIPMTLMTRGVDRRQLVLLTTAIFVTTNVLTMTTSSLAVMLVARLVAGCCAGLLWAVLAGYATRLVLPDVAGRAMSVAMLGTPLALALGIPLGSTLGGIISWRGTFLVISAAATLVLVLGIVSFPSVPGEAGSSRRRSVLQVVALPGLLSVLIATALFATAHNLVYTYLPSLIEGRKDLSLQGLLFAFGGGAVVGLMVVGRTIDARLSQLARGTVVSLALMLFASTFLPLMPPFPAWFVAIGWGLVFGGAPTVFQTASARICGDSQEVGQALVVSVWNGCVALAGAVGGGLVDANKVILLPLIGTVLSVIGYQAVASGGFEPAGHRRTWLQSLLPRRRERFNAPTTPQRRRRTSARHGFSR